MAYGQHGRTMNLIKNFHQCTFCNSRRSFVSIEENLGQTLRKFNFPYNLSDFETLSYKNYSCGSCGSSDRDRLYKLYIDKVKGINSSSKILDFAPSKQFGDYLKSFTKNYRSADLFIDGVDDRVDITNMSIYKNDTFDFFVCSHILEHVDDDVKALSELYRVTKKGGKGILMTPIIDIDNIQDEDPDVKDTKERWKRFAQDDHVRLYEKEVFLKRVRDSGFRVHIYKYSNLGLKNILKNGIYLKARLYIVEKPAD